MGYQLNFRNDLLGEVKENIRFLSFFSRKWFARADFLLFPDHLE